MYIYRAWLQVNEQQVERVRPCGWKEEDDWFCTFLCFFTISHSTCHVSYEHEKHCTIFEYVLYIQYFYYACCHYVLHRFEKCVLKSDQLHPHLQCWATLLPIYESEPEVEPILVWLVWLGSKWIPLRFFSVLHPNAKHQWTTIWIAKAAMATLIWHWTTAIAACLSICWLCVVMTWNEASFLAVKLWCYAGLVPWCGRFWMLLKCVKPLLIEKLNGRNETDKIYLNSIWDCDCRSIYADFKLKYIPQTINMISYLP